MHQGYHRRLLGQLHQPGLQDDAPDKGAWELRNDLGLRERGGIPALPSQRCVGNSALCLLCPPSLPFGCSRLPYAASGVCMLTLTSSKKYSRLGTGASEREEYTSCSEQIQA